MARRLMLDRSSETENQVRLENVLDDLRTARKQEKEHAGSGHTRSPKGSETESAFLREGRSFQNNLCFWTSGVFQVVQEVCCPEKPK